MLFSRQMIRFAAKHGFTARVLSITRAAFPASKVKGHGNVGSGLLRIQRRQVWALKESPCELGGGVELARGFPNARGHVAMSMDRDELLPVTLDELDKHQQHPITTPATDKPGVEYSTSSTQYDTPAIVYCYGAASGTVAPVFEPQGTTPLEGSPSAPRDSPCLALPPPYSGSAGAAETVGLSDAKAGVTLPGLARLGTGCRRSDFVSVSGGGAGCGGHYAMGHPGGVAECKPLPSGCLNVLSKFWAKGFSRKSCLLRGNDNSICITASNFVRGESYNAVGSFKRFYSSAASDSYRDLSKTLLIIPWPFSNVDKGSVVDFMNENILKNVWPNKKLFLSDLISVKMMEKEQIHDYKVLEVEFSDQSTYDLVYAQRRQLKGFNNDERARGRQSVILASGKHDWRYHFLKRYLVKVRQYWIGKNKSYYRRIDFNPDWCLGEPTIRIDGVNYTCDTLPKKWWGKIGKYTGQRVVIGEDEKVWTKIVIDGWEPPSGDFSDEDALKQDFANFINEVGYLRSAQEVMAKKEIVSIFRKPNKKRKYPIINVELSSPEIGQAIIFNRHTSKNVNRARRAEGLPSITIHRQDRYSKFERDKRYLHGLCNYMVEKKGYHKDHIRTPYDSSAVPTICLKGRDYTRAELPKALCKEYEDWKKEMNSC